MNGGNGTPRFPRIDGFRVSGPSTSSRFSIVNGRTSSTSSFTYQLVPQSEGPLLSWPFLSTWRVGPTRPRPFESRSWRDRSCRAVLEAAVSTRSGRGKDGASPRLRQTMFSFGPRYPALGLSRRGRSRHLSCVQQVHATRPDVDDDPPLTGFWVEEVNFGSPIHRRAAGRERTGILDLPDETARRLPARTGAHDPAFDVVDGFSHLLFRCIFARASRPIVLRSSAVTLDVKPAPASRARPRFHRCGGDVRARRGVEPRGC